MSIILNKSNIMRLVLLFTSVVLLITSGCVRYARNVNSLYEPSSTVRGGTGEIYIIIPESQQTQSPDIKWVFGDVTDGDNRKVDNVISPRSSAEIVQTALSLELKKGGYGITLTSKHRDDEKWAIDISKTEIKLDQVSALADIKATCRVLVGLNLYKNGQLVKLLQYESTSSKTDIKDRDLLAQYVLGDALQSVMLKALPDIHNLFKP